MNPFEEDVVWIIRAPSIPAIFANTTKLMIITTIFFCFIVFFRSYGYITRFSLKNVFEEPCFKMKGVWILGEERFLLRKINHQTPSEIYLEPIHKSNP